MPAPPKEACSGAGGGAQTLSRVCSHHRTGSAGWPSAVNSGCCLPISGRAAQTGHTLTLTQRIGAAERAPAAHSYSTPFPLRPCHSTPLALKVKPITLPAVRRSPACHCSAICAGRGGVCGVQPVGSSSKAMGPNPSSSHWSPQPLRHGFKECAQANLCPRASNMTKATPSFTRLSPAITVCKRSDAPTAPISAVTEEDVEQGGSRRVLKSGRSGVAAAAGSAAGPPAASIGRRMPYAWHVTTCTSQHSTAQHYNSACTCLPRGRLR